MTPFKIKIKYITDGGMGTVFPFVAICYLCGVSFETGDNAR